MLNILACFAEHERDRISERTKDAMGFLKRNNKTTGNAPYGKMADENGNLIANPEEKKVLRRLRKMMKQKISLAKMAQKLNEEGLKNRKGNAWTKGSIQNLRNRIVHGYD